MGFIHIFKRPIFFFITLFCISAFLLILINYKIFAYYIFSPVVFGWDGASHEAIGHYYADNIFPNTWGWVPNWFAGMPFPQFYPPVFYFLVATIYHLFNIPYLVAFKLVVVLSLVIVPVISSLLAYKYGGGRKAAFFTVVVSVFLLSFLGTSLSRYGISIYSTFNVGLITQLVGFVFLLLWVYYFFEIEKKMHARYLSGLFLFLLFLTNVHVAINSAIIFLVAYSVNVIPQVVYDRKQFFQKTKLYFYVGFFPLLVSAFWSLPMLYFYSFTSVRSLDYKLWNSLNFSVSATLIILFLIISSYYSLRDNKKQIFIITIASLVLFTLSAHFIPYIFPTLPLHQERWIATAYYLSPILIGYCLVKFVNSSIHGFYKIIMYSVLIIGFLFLWIMYSYVPYLGGFSFGKEHQYAQSIAQELGSEQRMISVEVYSPDNQPTDRILYSGIGKFGGQSIYTVFRESSISSIFMTPLRNSFSKVSEMWAIRTFLSFPDSMLISAQGMDKKLDRARWMGLEYFLVRTKDYHEAFTTSPLVHKVTDFGPWSLYALNQHIERAEALHYNPVLVFSVLDFKTFDFSRQDYVRLAEEAFFADRFDPALVFADVPSIDAHPDLEKFSAVIVSRYKYNNYVNAFELLKEYSKDHPLILIESNDILFRELQELNSSLYKVYVVKKVYEAATVEPVRSRAGEMFGIIDEGKEEVNESEITLEYKPSMKGKRIDIIFASSTPTDIPVYIKQSYFPTWQRTDGEKVYLASPTYMLTYAHDSFTLEFKDPWILSLGRFVSGLTVVIVLMFLYRDCRKKKSNLYYHS